MAQQLRACIALPEDLSSISCIITGYDAGTTVPEEATALDSMAPLHTRGACSHRHKHTYTHTKKNRCFPYLIYDRTTPAHLCLLLWKLSRAEATQCLDGR